LSVLVIVESPTKAKTIAKYLGPGYNVKASIGHICDLPQKSLAVDPDTYALTYEVIPGKEDVVKQLRAAVLAADSVILATDPDREGEAIAFHLESELKIKNAKRVRFHEIDKASILTAMQSLTTIDYHLVHAQEARRAEDRLVGYLVSSALRSKTGRALSAGRVQSVGLGLIVAREEAIAAFNSRGHFGAEATFATPDPAKPWTAYWDVTSHLPAGEKLFTDEAFAKRVAALRDFRVTKAADTVTKSPPPAPFTSSTMQQAGDVQLKIGSEVTMSCAQKLFEGTGDGGFITYHRSDSPNLSDKAFAAIVEYANANGLPVRDTKRTWDAKESAQEGHEAIRPTNFDVIDCGLGGHFQRVYEMIRNRALASQMADAEFDVRTLTLESTTPIDGKPIVFIGRGRTLRTPGWRAITDGDAAEETKADPFANNPVPALSQGAAIRASDSKLLTKKTQPPSRYTDASLTKELEKNGVGRPSTYVSIKKVIQARGYVELRSDRKFYPLELGVILTKALRGHFAFADVAFTADMEQDLDAIADGTNDYLSVVRAADTQLQQELAAFAGVQIEAVSLQTGGACPTCAIGELTKRPRKPVAGANAGPVLYFWSCSRYPQCKAAHNDKDGKPDLTPRAPRIEGGLCTKCGVNQLVQHMSARGTKFWGCSGWKKDGTGCDESWPDLNDKPDFRERAEQFSAGPCPVCSTGKLLRRERKDGSGSFYGCSRWNAEKKPCDAKYPEKNDKPDLSFTAPQKGPKCKCKGGYLMRRERKDGSGAFWSCSDWKNGCKNSADDEDGKPIPKKKKAA
jgi:DNA topoisomerase-1